MPGDEKAQVALWCDGLCACSASLQAVALYPGEQTPFAPLDGLGVGCESALNGEALGFEACECAGHVRFTDAERGGEPVGGNRPEAFEAGP